MASGVALAVPQLPPRWVSDLVPQAGTHPAPAPTSPRERGILSASPCYSLPASSPASHAHPAISFHRTHFHTPNCNTRTRLPPLTHSLQPALLHPRARLLSQAQHSSSSNTCTLIPHSTLGTSRRPTLAPRARRSWEPGRAPSSPSIHGHSSPFSWPAQTSKAAWLLEAALPGSCFAPTQTWRQRPAGHKRAQAGEAGARERVRPAESPAVRWADERTPGAELGGVHAPRRVPERTSRPSLAGATERPGRATRRLSQPRPQRPRFHRKQNLRDERLFLVPDPFS